MDDYFHIFDFDYTLYQTFELISVWSPRGDFIKNNKKCFRMNSRDYIAYQVAEDEQVNSESFDTFDTIDWNKAICIEPVCNIFNLVSDKMILTARQQSVDHSIKQKLPGDYRITGLGSGIPQDKICYIKSLKYKNVILYDDSVEVIKLCKQNNIPCAHIRVNQKNINIEYSL